jgi:hypothetical protein
MTELLMRGDVMFGRNHGAARGEVQDGFSKLRVSPAVLAVGLLFGSGALSWAEENIGGATTVINRVQGDLPTGNEVPVVQGDSVFLNEAVKSGEESKGKFLLKDNTEVTVGPGSTLKLDKFVYAGPSQAGTIALNLTKGTMRFVTGDASKRAYTIYTPNAAIGVRGTILRIAVTPTGTQVINEEGQAIVCQRSNNEYASIAQLQKRRCNALPTHKQLATNGVTRTCGCAELLVPGQEATVSSTQIAITEAPLGAISDPIIGGGIGFAGAPLIGAGVLAAAAVAGAIAVSETSNGGNQTALSP